VVQTAVVLLSRAGIITGNREGKISQ